MRCPECDIDDGHGGHGEHCPLAEGSAERRLAALVAECKKIEGALMVAGLNSWALDIRDALLAAKDGEV